MRRPFARLMEMTAAIPEDSTVTLGQLAGDWDEPIGRIMDAIDAVRVLNGEPGYIGVEDSGT